jgi:hypothetical protein
MEAGRFALPQMGFKVEQSTKPSESASLGDRIRVSFHNGDSQTSILPRR